MRPKRNLYVTRDPDKYAANFKTRLLEHGCSEEYAEEAAKDVRGRLVQVASPFESNMVQCGKGTS